MKPFTESDRYEYPSLTPESIVIDAGGYEGNFAKHIAEKYGCTVHVYEPIFEFYEKILERFAGTTLSRLIHVHNAGIGATGRREMFGVKGDQTGIACSGNSQQSVTILPIAAVLLAHAGADKQVGLLKLNVESMEFEILEALLDQGLTHRFNNIQVQPHNIIPRAEERWNFIKNRMMLNHRITWDAPWIWTNFELK